MHRDPIVQAAVLALAAVLVVLGIATVGSLGSGRGATSSVDHGAALAPLSSTPLSASLTVTPSQLTEGQSLSVQVTASGGDPPYSYSYNGLPPGCGAQNAASFNCNPTGTGSFTISASVADSGTNRSSTNSVGVTVTSSSNGNGNGNGKGNGGGNNSSGGLSSLFSGFSGILSLLLIFGIVGFVTWILLIVGVWVIAVTLMRRLPKRGALDAAAGSGKCVACGAATPGGARFCPSCGASTSPKPA